MNPKTLILTHCYPPDGGSFIKHRSKLIDAQVLTMARPLGLWNFVKFVNDAVGSARKYEMIEAHWLFPAGIAARIASKLTGTPYRVYCHGTDVMMASRSWFWRWVAEWVTDYAQEVRCVSKFLANKSTWFRKLVPSKYGWVNREITIDPMEVDKSVFYDQPTEREFIGIIIKKNVGRFENVLLKVKRWVIKSGFGYIEFSNCNVHTMAPQEGLARNFRRCQVVVLASENEGYGLMLAEAAECGAKIIGVNEGGIPEVVAKYGGLLFDGTVEDLEDKIRQALGVCHVEAKA